MKLFSENTKKEIQETLSCYKIIFYETIDSTNSQCQKIWKENPINGLVLVANEQLKGRGRYGRTWESRPNVNIYVSIVQKNFFGRNVGLINLFCGIVLYETIEKLYGNLNGRLTLKWPNDLYCGNKKIAGILIETLNTDFCNLILGIGINVHSQLNDLPLNSTSLKIEKEISQNARIEIIKELLERLETFSVDESKRNEDLLLEKYRKYTSLTKDQEYTYSSSFYKYTGLLEKIYKDGTIDILSNNKRIYLAT